LHEGSVLVDPRTEPLSRQCAPEVGFVVERAMHVVDRGG